MRAVRWSDAIAVLWVSAAVIVWAGASANAQSRDRHPGKVIVESTSGDAAVVTGGLVVGTTSDPSGQNLDVRSSADDLSGGVRISRADGSYFILNMDDGGAGSAWGTIQAGDGSAFRPVRLNTAGGQVLFGDGSAGAPSISFLNDSDSGFYQASGDIYMSRNGTSVTRWFTSSGAPVTEVIGGAYGTGAVTGSVLILGRNTSGAAAPGCMYLGIKGASTGAAFFVDSTGVARLNVGAGGVAACPTENGGDAIGTIVGTQTSARATKHVAGEVTDTAAAMAIIRSTPVWQFTYKNGAYNGETFYGITTDDSPIFGMDGGKSFNPVTAFGATVLALRDLDARLAALERENDRLRGELARAKQ